MIDLLFEHFKLFFPSFARDTVDYHIINDYELVAELNDGLTFLYDDMDNTIRRLPKDRFNMSELECRKEFGWRLYKIMYHKGMTQVELSQKTGISQPLLSSYISGKRLPGFYNIDKIAKALGCSVDEFRYI